MSSVVDLVKFSKKTYEKGLVSATDGNLSIRLDKNKIAITRSGINKGEVKESDIIIINNFGDKLEGSGIPSSETKIHLLAYNERPEINAVVHCHPIYSTAFATAGLDFTRPVFPEVILSIGPVPLCSYGTPSTEELPNSMKQFIKESWALLLQNHGAVTFGENIENAYNRMEKLEHSAKTIFIARLLGGEMELNKDQLNKLYSIAESTYGINIKTKIEGSHNSSCNHKLDDNSLDNVNTNYSEIIDARLRARAGNPRFDNNTFKKLKAKDLNSKSIINLIPNLLEDFNN